MTCTPFSLHDFDRMSLLLNHIPQAASAQPRRRALLRLAALGCQEEDHWARRRRQVSWLVIHAYRLTIAAMARTPFSLHDFARMSLLLNHTPKAASEAGD